MSGIGTSGYLGGPHWADLYFRHWRLIFGCLLVVLGASVRFFLAVYYFAGFDRNPTPGAQFYIGLEPWVSFLAILIGALLLVRYALLAARRWYIRRNGERIDAKITVVEADRRTSINEYHPFHITASAPVNGIQWEFRSQAFVFDPSQYLKIQGIDTLPLYVLGGDRKTYVLDTSFLTWNDPVRLLSPVLIWSFFAIAAVGVSVFLS